jgi:hypothetical protein
MAIAEAVGGEGLPDREMAITLKTFKAWYNWIL